MDIVFNFPNGKKTEEIFVNRNDHDLYGKRRFCFVQWRLSVSCIGNFIKKKQLQKL
jgi:hypothetical protein